jgi:hypothetical protein
MGEIQLTADSCGVEPAPQWLAHEGGSSCVASASCVRGPGWIPIDQSLAPCREIALDPGWSSIEITAIIVS